MVYIGFDSGPVVELAFSRLCSLVRRLEASAKPIKMGFRPRMQRWASVSTEAHLPGFVQLQKDMRSYMKIDDRTLGLNAKKDGKTTVSGRIAVSADGKTRTVTVSGTDPTGKKFQSTAVYDKQ